VGVLSRRDTEARRHKETGTQIGMKVMRKS
jgi:hypothetical protein